MCRKMAQTRAVVLTKTPEANIAVFALLLNFPWEVLQALLYDGMAEASYAQATLACLRATFADVVIMLLAYAAVAACARSRHWILAPRRLQLILFVMIGVSVTAAIERPAIRGHWVTSWPYLPAMPLPPGTGIGLMPLAQWLVLPLLTVWYVQRQLTVSAPKR